MKMLMEKIDGMFIKAKIAKDNFVSQERGDTNFISIAIVLVIVCVVASAIFVFKDSIMSVFNTQTDDFLDTYNAQ